MSVTWGWDSFWSSMKSMPVETLAGVGREWRNDEFTHWVESRSPKTQIEVLESAPEAIQVYFRSKNALSPYAIMKLGIPSSTRIIDKRRK